MTEHSTQHVFSLQKFLFSSAYFLMGFFFVVVELYELFVILEIKPFLVTSFVVFFPIL